MGIKHAHQSAIPDDPTADVGADEWNAAHTIEAPLEVVASPDVSAVTITDYEVTAGNNASCFTITGSIAGAGGDVRVFQIAIANPDSRSGDLFRLLGGVAGVQNMMSVSTFGDTEVAGLARIKALSGLDDHGHA